jgi:hypothetical protein
MKRITAAVVASLVSPLAPSIVGAIYTDLASGLVDRSGMVLIFYLYGLIAMAFLGVPAFLLALRFEQVKWWSSLLAGLAIGVAINGLISASAPSLWPAMQTGMLGALCGLVFFSIWRLGKREQETT